MNDPTFLLYLLAVVLLWVLVIVLQDRWLKWRIPLLIGCTVFFLADAFIDHDSNSRFFALISFLLLLQNYEKLKTKSNV
ncbi:MAG: hypothetical protein EOO14_12845 [Chitinophagaceae bacterium]|nr:MAG: hypothetical protein EOO14_12845 [Chitinophagaceae bacterium]